MFVTIGTQRVNCAFELLCRACQLYFEVHLNTGRIQFVSEMYSEEIKGIICSITNLFVA